MKNHYDGDDDDYDDDDRDDGVVVDDDNDSDGEDEDDDYDDDDVHDDDDVDVDDDDDHDDDDDVECEFSHEFFRDIPIKNSRKAHRGLCDVLLHEYLFPGQDKHWSSLESMYLQKSTNLTNAQREGFLNQLEGMISHRLQNLVAFLRPVHPSDAANVHFRCLISHTRPYFVQLQTWIRMLPAIA